MQQRHLKFGEWLLGLELLSAESLQRVLELQAAQPEPQYLGELLVQEAAIEESIRDSVLWLQKLLASSTRLAELEIQPETLRLIPARIARDHNVLPLMRVGDRLVIAVSQHDDQELLNQIEGLSQCRVFPVAYRASDIQEAAQNAYNPRRAQQSGMEWIQDELPGSGPVLTFVGSGDALGSGARNQTCLHLYSQDACLLIDCGPTSLTALKQLGLPTSQLDGILLTHAHGDHFAGVPFILLDLQLQQREQPFWIMGPPHLLDSVRQLNQLCYGSLYDQLSFELRWLDIEHEPRSVPGTGVMIYPFTMLHQSQRLCLGYQLHLPEEKILAFTGDTAWNDNLEGLARDTDLLICECSYFSLPEPAIKHLSYQELSQQRARLKTRQLVLTHMGQEMLQKVAAGQVDFETAYDGLTIELGSS